MATPEEIDKMSLEEVTAYQAALNREMVDGAPAAMRPRLEAILFRVEMQCSHIRNPIIRTMTVNRMMVAAVAEYMDELKDDDLKK